MKKNCNKCKKEFEPKDELDMFCSQDCKEEALAELEDNIDGSKTIKKIIEE